MRRFMALLYIKVIYSQGENAGQYIFLIYGWLCHYLNHWADAKNQPEKDRVILCCCACNRPKGKLSSFARTWPEYRCRPGSENACAWPQSENLRALVAECHSWMKFLLENKGMSKQRAEIKITQTGIGGILKLHNLRVPSHQRDYSWSEKEVTKLFQDLAKAISDDEAEYFLGTIVTIPDEAGRLEVIDGQQRLATITILLWQIARYLTGKDDFIAKSVDGFLTYPDRAERATLPKLKLNLVDNDFFRRMLAGESPEATRISHRLLAASFTEAAARVISIVAGFGEKDHGDILNKWITFIEDRAEVILLQIPSGANAYKMFETLNDRGLKTTQADLVKNYLFGEAENRLDEAQDSWSMMRAILESLQEDEDVTVTFLRHALIAIQGRTREDQVYEAVQRSAKRATGAITFLRQIETLSNLYSATFTRDHEKWNAYPDGMKLAIQTVNFFNIHPFRPVLLAIAAKFAPKETVEAYEAFISLGVRLIIASSTRSGSIEETLSDTANNVFTGKIKTVAQLKKALSAIVPTDEKFRQEFEVATVSKAPFARYYLRSLERVAKEEPTPWFKINEDKEIINLEHILPHKPENNWPQFTAEEAVLYYKRLGNMALHSKKINSDLKSAKFSDKRSTYNDCPYELTRQIATVTNWTVNMICDRQKKMADLALLAWPW